MQKNLINYTVGVGRNLCLFCRTRFWCVDLGIKIKLDFDFRPQNSVELHMKSKFGVDWYMKFGLTMCPPRRDLLFTIHEMRDTS